MNNRRNLLAGAAGLVAGAAMLPAAAMPTTGHPDTELIRLCAEHVANLDAYNRDGGMLAEGHPDPLWDAYARTRDAIGQAKPRTLAGMVAKARAAKAEAKGPDGREREPDHQVSEQWAWDLLNDLLAGSART